MPLFTFKESHFLLHRKEKRKEIDRKARVSVVLRTYTQFSYATGKGGQRRKGEKGDVS